MDEIISQIAKDVLGIDNLDENVLRAALVAAYRAGGKHYDDPKPIMGWAAIFAAKDDGSLMPWD